MVEVAISVLRLKRHVITLFAIAIIAAALSTGQQAVAQGGAGTASAGQIDVVVRDALSRPVALARIEIQSGDGQVVTVAASDSNGGFSAKGITAGTYAVIVSREGFQSATSIVTLPSGGGAVGASIVLAANQALNLTVAAKRLDEVRNALSPTIGANVYHQDQKTIEALPQGENTPLYQVLLHAPGVSQDSAASGQLHVRDDHANLQYRINGILLPEGIVGFNQTIDTRFASQVNLITGALPAQFGFRTAGVVDIQTKSGAFDKGGRAEMFGGSDGLIQPSVEYGGSLGALSYFVSASYLQTDRGVEAATPDPIHDHSEQHKGFAYLSYLLDPTSRLSLIVGSADSRFQIPNRPGQPIVNTLDGVDSFDSSKLNERQNETNRYAVLALQGSSGDFDYQIAPFSRFSAVRFKPDPIGDLVFSGVASDIYRNSLANGIQGDGSYRLSASHTLRAGVFFQHEKAVANNTAAVFAIDPTSGIQATTPATIVDNNTKVGLLEGAYLQDEWKVTPKLTVNFGARLDNVDAFTHENALGPRVNAVYQATESTTLHAGYARYFTPPPLELVSQTSLDKFANTSNAPASPFASPVKAERGNYYDVGIAQRITPRIQLGLDGYYKDARNLLDDGTFAAPLIATPFNYGEGIAYGLEFSATYTSESWNGYFNLARATEKGKNVISGQSLFSADDLDFIRNHFIHTDHDQLYTGSAGLSYTLAGLGTVLGADLIYGSGLRKDATDGSPNAAHVGYYTQVNLGIVQPIALGSWGDYVGRFSVINLFDKVYQIRDGSGVGVFAPQFGPRRGFYVGLSRSF
jgi:outer membrane receptor protein involved in Fe transport